MSKPMPKISKYMTMTPHSIGKDQTLARASDVMREFKIRHLPVLEGGRVLGILSERDVLVVETFKDVDPKKVSVEEAMSPAPYAVSPEAALDEVVGEMAEHKYGSAVIMQNDKLVGIVTTVDLMRAFHDLLHTRLST